MQKQKEQFGIVFWKATILLAIVTLFGSFAYSKELANRLGVGYADQFSEHLPSIAMKYFPDSELGVGAQLGVDTKEDQSKFGFMVKLYRNIFPEDNMNFYMGTGAGLVSQEIAGKSNSGFELNGFAGGEFFLTGLESLGFSFETGVGVTSVKSEVRFRTVGSVAIVFYF